MFFQRTEDLRMEYLEVLQGSELFAGVEADSLREMLGCLGPRIAEYEKDEVILATGACTQDFAVVLRGAVLIVQDDYWGNRNILSALAPGELFAESFAARPDAPLNVSAIADAPTAVMFLGLKRVLATCPTACPHHRRIIDNLLAALADKNHRLNEKLTHISQRGTRQKLLSYLSAEAQKKGTPIFEIPFNRQQLADYLSVDRSALSAELSKLKAEGVLDYQRSVFKIL